MVRQTVMMLMSGILFEQVVQGGRSGQSWQRKVPTPSEPSFFHAKKSFYQTIVGDGG
jgi:hypothetical protein